MFNTYQEYLYSPLWKAKREMVLERDWYKCIKCNSNHKLNVHHWSYTTEWWTEPMRTLFTICNECHSTYHITYWNKPTIETTIYFIKEKIKVPATTKELYYFDIHVNKRLKIIEDYLEGTRNHIDSDSYRYVEDIFMDIKIHLAHWEINLEEALEPKTYSSFVKQDRICNLYQ